MGIAGTIRKKKMVEDQNLKSQKQVVVERHNCRWKDMANNKRLSRDIVTERQNLLTGY